MQLLRLIVLLLLAGALTSCDPINPVYFVNDASDTLYLRTTPDSLERIYVQIPHSRRDTTVKPMMIVLPPGDTCLYGYIIGDLYKSDVFERIDIGSARGRKTIQGRDSVHARMTTASYGAGDGYFFHVP